MVDIVPPQINECHAAGCVDDSPFIDHSPSELKDTLGLARQPAHGANILGLRGCWFRKTQEQGISAMHGWRVGLASVGGRNERGSVA
jgi:hypothetical protein